ncbi:hypothetical protein ACFFJX_19215 [Pseudarcicella hirudinis]|uniref:SecDF P1 head subdomain-containing protein n=1 Tax=Pseudarcicella hirudinis TaxID=1079859 RepID=UPI0035ED6476
MNDFGAGINALGDYLAKEEAANKIASTLNTPSSALKSDSSKTGGSLAGQLTKTPAKKDSAGAKQDTTAGSALTKLFIPINNTLGVYRKDTARVNELFRRPEVRAMFPAELTFAWYAKGIPAINGDEILQLEALKKGEGQAAPLEGDVITDAAQDYDQSGRPEVTMSMNGTGARIWKNLTAANIGKRIAIVLDNYVYSAPTINGEISGGRSSISGSLQ